jgi:hypothetical protein
VAYARSGKETDLRHLVESLAHERPLKAGALYRCTVCHQPWFMGEDGRMLTHVPRERESVLAAWSAVSLVPREEHLQVLRAIGGSGADHYGDCAGSLRFPCSVRLRDGRWADPAILLLTEDPPIGPQDDITLCDAVASIEPTRFALPAAVRLATSAAEEVRMGFAPTRVSTRDGRRFVLNWWCDVVNAGGVMGSELALTDEIFDANPSNTLSAGSTRATYVYADWFPGAHALALTE